MKTAGACSHQSRKTGIMLTYIKDLIQKYLQSPSAGNNLLKEEREEVVIENQAKHLSVLRIGKAGAERVKSLDHHIGIKEVVPFEQMKEWMR